MLWKDYNNTLSPPKTFFKFDGRSYRVGINNLIIIGYNEVANDILYHRNCVVGFIGSKKELKKVRPFRINNKFGELLYYKLKAGGAIIERSFKIINFVDDFVGGNIEEIEALIKVLEL